jgi:hypothetical protein
VFWPGLFSTSKRFGADAKFQASPGPWCRIVPLMLQRTVPLPVFHQPVSFTPARQGETKFGFISSNNHASGQKIKIGRIRVPSYWMQ